MFTGIVEEVGEVVAVEVDGGNRHIEVRARMAPDLRVDQSLSHNGVCLTVVALHGDRYRVTAVEETLRRSTLGTLRPGHRVNLERAMRLGDRLDGHLVQGHVDRVVEYLAVQEEQGSWRFTFRLPAEDHHLVVPKGSICLQGISLTVADLLADRFSVAIIPYTFGHTTFGDLRPGDGVNVEYDVLGKYVARMLERRQG